MTSYDYGNEENEYIATYIKKHYPQIYDEAFSDYMSEDEQ